MISETFKLDSRTKDCLIDCYKASPIFKDINNKRYIMKGEIGISLKPFEPFNISLKSLWNSIFKIRLADQTEPILLSGPSGFKTYLSQMFLLGSSIIALNQESTIHQLLGTSGFFSKSAAKLFYLEYISKISVNNSRFLELKSKLEKGELKRTEIVKLYSETKSPFQYSLDHLTDKLFQVNKKSNCILSNISLEFQPGLFLDAILERKSLILKNLTNLPTIVLERFNELFSGKQNLTLNEDIHNTFTPESEKELKNFSDLFRVFATCSSNSTNSLSEAVLSRFTVISIPEYTQEEQKIGIGNYISNNQFQFEHYNINKIIQLSTACYERLKKSFSFTQIIKTVELCSILNNDLNCRSQEENLALISYRIFGGLLDSSETRIQYNKLVEEIILETNDQSDTFLPINYLKSPLVFANNDGYQGIQSNISKLFIKCPNPKIPDMNVCFIPILSEIIDIIHLGLLIHNPVILEGSPGQGKQTAIKYIAEALNYQVVNIIISQSTKVDDLLGNVTISRDKDNNIQVEMIETKLIKAIKSYTETNNIIVFHNIDKASSAVLNILVSLFDTRVKEILLPNGSTVLKGRLNIIGIFSTTKGFSGRDI